MFCQVESRAEAEDLTQEVFVNLYRRMNKKDFGPGESVEGWLFGVARNLLRNRNQKVSRWLRRLQEFFRSGGVSDPIAQPYESLELQRERRRIRERLAQMSEEDRALLLLDAEGYKGPELAEFLGLSSGAVRKRLQRARERARNLFNPPN